MLLPNPNDTIVAVSTDWQPSALGIVRLSGPESFALVGRLGAQSPEMSSPCWTSARLQLDTVTALPATVLWFRGPRSYTGQDVVELHTVGCLPLLRELSARLIKLGARRALPGEFTARGFTNGRLDADQVAGVLDLMQASDEAGVRQAARAARVSRQRGLTEVVEKLTDLLARVEAGIDFVEEEDVRFITPAEMVRTVDELLSILAEGGHDDAGERHAARPHVALVGLPNAGKSTLFNALLGRERALVSPVLGTTRDVLSAELDLDGVNIVLQDCAGLGGTSGELELATHLATERATEQADLLLWVHAADTPWDARESAACTQIPTERRLLVRSKLDLPMAIAAGPVPPAFTDTVAVSAASGAGLPRLRQAIADRLRDRPPSAVATRGAGELRAAAGALHRARSLVADNEHQLVTPELVALELRAAHGLLAEQMSRPLDEELLERVFAQFCVGK